MQSVGSGLHRAVGLQAWSFVLVSLDCHSGPKRSDSLCDGYLVGFPDPDGADVAAFLMQLSCVFNYHSRVSPHHWQH